jgi:iron(III) transport system permease protein
MPMSARIWLLAPLICAALIAAPIVFALSSLASGGSEALAHVWSTTGPRYVVGTALLCLLVAPICAILGAATAALVSLADFPGRRALSVLLVLPLAMPAYISAYAWGDVTGPFGALAGLLGADHPFRLRSLIGAAFVIAFAVYPYVYLATRASLESRSGNYLDAARMLGAHPSAAVFRALLPVGRAAIAGGLALALMETIADYGVADYFGVQTLSVGVFRTWHGLGELEAASQLASALFLFALLLVLLEEFSRRGRGVESARGGRSFRRMPLAGAAALGAGAFCSLPVVLGFMIPALVLIAKLPSAAFASGFAALADAAGNTALAAGLGGAVTLGAALALALAMRGGPAPAVKIATRAATLGYAMPGAVIAIGVVAVNAALQNGAGFAPSALAALVYAYAVRFLTAAYNAVDAGLSQIHPLTDDAASTLGAPPLRVAARILAPLAGRSIAVGALIVIIDIARELPATLLLRPFDFETLATRVYRLASDERLADAAPAALLLVAASLVPTLLISRMTRGRYARTL